MKHLRTLTATALVAGFALAGCYGTTEVRGRVYASNPNLEYIGPDVQVVADYDRPVFYSNSYYWQYDNGLWFRSSAYDRGFVRVRTVPTAVLRIDRPYAYIRYHHRGMANRRPHRY